MMNTTIGPPHQAQSMAQPLNQIPSRERSPQARSTAAAGMSPSSHR